VIAVVAILAFFLGLMLQPERPEDFEDEAPTVRR
jgi:hypothetical protein